MSGQRRRAAGGGPRIVSQDSFAITSSSSTLTRTFSLTGAFEHIIVLTGGRRSTAGTNGVSGVTLGGSAMTEVVKHAGANREAAGIYIFASASTSPAVVVTFATTQMSAEAIVYGVAGLDSATATGTATDSDGSPADLDLNTSAGGLIIAGGRDRSEVETYTVTGLDAATELRVAGLDGRVVGFESTNVAAATPRDIQIAFSASVSNMSMVAASFR